MRLIDHRARLGQRSMPAHWKRRAAIVAGLGALLLATLAIGVPLAVEQIVLARASEALGRRITVEHARFNPLTLALSAQGVRMAEADGSDFVSIDRVLLRLSIASAWRRAPVLDALGIEHPQVHVVRTAERRFNFSDIVDRQLARPASPSSAPASFALNNIELRNGEIDIDDRVLGQRHAIRDLVVALPFISNLAYATDREVEPEVSATIDGSRFDLRAESTPFKASRATTLNLKLDRLDLASYSKLLPTQLGFHVASGKLGADLSIDFARASSDAPPNLRISGPVRIDALKLDKPDGSALAAARSIAVTLQDVQPFNARAWLSHLAIDAPEVTLARERDGRFDIAKAWSPDKQHTPASEAADAPQTPSAFDWRIEGATIHAGKLAFADHTLSPAFQASLAPIDATFGTVGNRAQAAAPVDVAVGFESAHLRWVGTLDLARSSAAGSVQIASFALARTQPYLDALLTARVRDGSLAADARFTAQWQTSPIELRVEQGSASIEHLALRRGADRAAPVVVAKRFALEGVGFDLTHRTLGIAHVAADSLEIALTRNADGIDLLHLVKRSTQSPGQPSAPWHANIDAIDLKRNALRWRDTTTATPAAFALVALEGRIDALSLDDDRPAHIDLKTRVEADAGVQRVRGPAGGTVAMRGTIEPNTLRMRLSIDASKLPLVIAQPYVEQRSNVAIADGAASAKGELSIDRVGSEALRYGWRGDARVERLHAVELASGDDLVNWGELTVAAIDASLAPGAPGNADHLQIGSIGLRDFFAKIIVSPQGRLNLLELAKKPGASADTANARVAPTAPGTVSPMPIDVGRIALEQGRVNFTDNFVKPNYRVNVTDLAGTIAAMSSRATAPADVALRGRVDGDAPVDIAGKVDPLGPRLFADIHASAQGIDLPALTPYSAKYAGYAIERGKLSVDVHYNIDHGKLEASNHVILDQLTFGDRVDSPSATKLPVLLAVALLKNRRGEIDVNLPVSGSIDDPQFSIFDVVVRVVVNLLLKAATSPFALLGSLFESGPDLSTADFLPGTATIAPASLQRIDALVKALDDRPALKLEIAGRVDPAVERADMQRVKIDRLIRAEKNKNAPDASDVSDVSAEERLQLLEKVYDAAKLPDKPRNAIGLAKSIPPAQMERLLIAGLPFGADEARDLAVRRAHVVRERIVEAGKIDEERVFVLAPRVGGDKANPACAANCAEFSLR